ncbi:SDR family NAD(P)-dependent oxidoreductase [Streptomyces sp. NBC_01728]|uniref:SDR family NAD(P)-dependent oxidoreductase n=1 Tax=unclassified Streptomyces TaxID=2593676 RepID=UPI00225B05CE|nr:MULTISPECIES: SDR family NAD(P)-dependent oxidoreductase [unclassified Streptomyces]MCX4460816.1 SDR family NAD(P)-dependent oxidoreductase [Streptomyces sp. NBC_01719]MCX4499854.1 SDR family NAD(P)-dependent oxidoreductase [Streptomyces sp. NBC_01728]
MNITGNVALVTGGASGLGLGTGQRLLDADAFVLLVDLPTSDGKCVAAGLGDRAVFAPADVTSEQDVKEVLDVAGRLGDVRLAVNCDWQSFAPMRPTRSTSMLIFGSSRARRRRQLG